jgi:hypothetical protein
MLIKRSVFSKFLTFILLLVAACSTVTNNYKTSPKDNNLQSEVREKKLLTKVDEIFIAPINNNVRRELQVSVKHLYKKLLNSWESGSGLKVNSYLSDELADAGSKEHNRWSKGLTAPAGIRWTLITRLEKYSERLGSDIGALEPAQVSFEQSIVDVKNRSIVWSSRFSLTDRAFTDNILVSKPSSGKWITALNLIKLGFDKSASAFNLDRETLFLNRQ